jgi:8-oxo-dGTP diphosphatase
VDALATDNSKKRRWRRMCPDPPATLGPSCTVIVDNSKKRKDGKLGGVAGWLGRWAVGRWAGGELGSWVVCDNGAVALTQTCLCLLTRVDGDGEREVLLGHKKTGLGTGKIVALGGHVEERETAAEAAAREVGEESGIEVAAESLREAAHITFLFPTRPAWDMTVEVFTSGSWRGEAAETEEIRPEWFPVADLPFDRMWDDGRQWVPRVLAGERLRATFSYAADCATVADAAIAALA